MKVSLLSHYKKKNVNFIRAHCTLPHVACLSDKSIIVWDYSKSVITHKIPLQELTAALQSPLSPSSQQQHQHANHSLASNNIPINVVQTPQQPEYIIDETMTSVSTNRSGSAAAVSITTSSSRDNNNLDNTIGNNNFVRSFNKLTEIHFHDRHVLFWEMGNRVSFANSGGQMGTDFLDSMLVLVFGNKVVIVNSMSWSTGSSRGVDGVAGISSNHGIYTIDMPGKIKVTSVLSLTPTLVLLGCTDGNLRFWDWHDKKKIIKVVKTGHERQVVQLANCKPENMNYTSLTDSHGNVKIPLRFCSVSADSSCLVWECQISTDGLKLSSPIGRIEKLLVQKQRDPKYQYVYFDSQRNTLLAHMASSQDFMGVFKLSSLSKRKSSKDPLPLLQPFSILDLSVDGANTSPGRFIPAHHASYPDTSITFWKTSAESSILELLASPMSNSQFAPEIHESLNLLSLELEGFVSDGIVVYQVLVPQSQNQNVIVLTNEGLLVLDTITEELSVGSNHLNIDGHLFLSEGLSLLKAQIPSNSLNPIGPIELRNKSIVYKSILAERIESDKKVHKPPQLILSPSKKYICLMWPSQSRYEIVHIPTLLEIKSGIPPAIDTGDKVKSFAWVGVDDKYAILLQTDDMDAPPPKSKKKQNRFDFKVVRKQKRKDDTSTIHKVSSTKEVLIKKLIQSVSGSLNPTISSQAAATAKVLGFLAVRGGKPIRLHGGILLCVSCSQQHGDDDDSEGSAYFYIRKKDKGESELVTLGPSFPNPDLVGWSEDGSLCCIVIGDKVVVYSCTPPVFQIIGSTTLSHDIMDSRIISVKFLNGSLVCASVHGVHIIFIGKRSIECFDVATSVRTPFFPSIIISSDRCSIPHSFIPIASPMILRRPYALDFFSGSLLLSTMTGLQAVSLNHPLLKIGILLSARLLDKCKMWFNCIQRKDHDLLARFLESMGYPQVGTDLPHISLETKIDICIEHKLTSTIESAIENYGVSTFRKLNVEGSEYSALERIGEYLISEGKTEVIRRIASESIVSGDVERNEALFLTALLYNVKESDAHRLLKRVVGTKEKCDDWLINFVRGNMF